MMFALRMFLLRQVRKANHRFGSKPLPALVARWLPWIVELAGRIPPIRRAISRLVINSYAYATPVRPLALSMAGDFTTWHSLTDRTFNGRHLRPSTAPEYTLPERGRVVALFEREVGKEIKSTDTSVFFAFFAQWFTDGFLRVSQRDPRRNSSNHHIDLCQIYGLHPAQTEKLRGANGELKSQFLDRDGRPDPEGEEYPPYLFTTNASGGLVIKPEFDGLHREKAFAPFLDAYEKGTHQMFAVGLEYGNSTIGHTIFNTTFLREHNRIAGILRKAYPEWDGDRIFETTRNILIVVLLKLVVEEYIKHIAPTEFPIEAVPFIAEGERWNRTNWMSIEFDLLYRWHSLVPDGVGATPLKDLVNRNSLVFERGIDSLVAEVSRERAGKIGLQNTPAMLIGMAEKHTVDVMRSAHLRSFNEYRKAFGLKPLTGFDQLTTDVELQKRLENLYGHIDRLEWYVGIFAEEYPEQRMMGELMTTMVACDAFTQAFTNPLLSKNVFNERTFSKVGLRIIEETRCLQDIFARNSKSPDRVFASFRWGAV